MARLWSHFLPKTLQFVHCKIDNGNSPAKWNSSLLKDELEEDYNKTDRLLLCGIKIFDLLDRFA